MTAPCCRLNIILQSTSDKGIFFTVKWLDEDEKFADFTERIEQQSSHPILDLRGQQPYPYRPVKGAAELQKHSRTSSGASGICESNVLAVE
jgi:hypothetical protein